MSEETKVSGLSELESRLSSIYHSLLEPDEMGSLYLYCPRQFVRFSLPDPESDEYWVKVSLWSRDGSWFNAPEERLKIQDMLESERTSREILLEMVERMRPRKVSRPHISDMISKVRKEHDG